MINNYVYNVVSNEECELFISWIGINIAFFRLIIIVIGLSSCTKIEAQYAICNLAQNNDPFVCYDILDEQRFDW